MDYTNCAKEILKELGGESNIKDLTHCITRLRFVLKDESIVDDERVKAIKGVMGVMKKGGQYQVIIGNDIVKCYNAVVSQSSLKLGGDTKVESEKKEPLTVKSVFNHLLDIISGSMSSIMAPLVGCGLVKIIVILLGFAGVSETNTTYQILTAIGDVCFYFLPVLLAYTSAKKFGTNPILAACVSAVLIHPTIISLLGSGEAVTFLGIKVTSATYSSSVVPALLSTWFMSLVEKALDRILPSWAKTIFKPMFLLLITVPVALVVLAPAGNIVGIGLATAMTWLQSKVGWLALAIFSGIMPFVVMTGMHWAFVPAAIETLATGGEGILLPAMLASNIALGAACVAVSMKTKNKELKSNAVASGVSALAAGVTEPGLYGVALPLKKPLMAACIGSAVSGLFIGIFGVLSYAFASPSLIAIVQFVNPKDAKSIIYPVIAAIISIVVTFILTLVLGFEDPVEEGEEKIVSPVPVEEPTEVTEVKTEGEKYVFAPIKGQVVPLSEVPDETFASEILGKGIAIVPEEGKVVAPFDGTVISVFDTLHAFGLKSKDGVEVLIHIGLETVRLNGEGFTSHIKQGDIIRKGDLLMEMDLDFIKKSGYETITPVIVSNMDAFANIETVKTGKVQKEEKVLKLS